MQTDPRGPIRLRSPLLATVVVAMSFFLSLLGATAAHAGPAVWTDPGGSGAKITLDPGDVVAGGRVAISGTGFVRDTGVGFPWIAIKPDDEDDLWAYGGTDAIDGAPGDAPIWFQAKADGTFSGWIDVPADTPTTGLGAGAYAGKHWFRILSGAFSSDTLSATRPITYQAYFGVTQKVQVGSLGPTGVYRTGTHYSQGGLVTLRGSQLAPSATVAVELDGTTLGAGVPTDAAGAIVALPASQVTIPPATTPGAHALTFSDGVNTITTPIVVHAAPTATVTNALVRPGGLVDVSVTGFVGVAGTGQKVGVLIGSGQAAPTVACIQADGTGAGRATVRVPDGQTGSQPIRFPAGAKCQTPADPGFAADDLPARAAVGSLAQTLTVDASAPAITVTGNAVRGSTAQVSGEGFPAGASLNATLDGTATGSPIAVGADGRFSATVPVASSVAAGEHLIFVSGTSTGAGTTVQVVDPTPDPPPNTGDGQTTPTTPTQPTTTPTTPTDPPKPAPSRATKLSSKSLKATKKGRVSLTMVRPSVAGKAAVSVTSRSKVRLKGAKKAKVLTLVKSATFSLKAGTAKQTSVLSLKLTADARALLKRVASVKVVVRVAPKGGKAFTTTLVLRG
ncbi:hypothetical protein AB0L40_13520 [Patulibacter sp. NPDC049589]|uniref:hypothetical protein n=1 Tax=Patulibacter sp. NPDC049589 TaxID=3154731 RepID=UPI003449EC4F